MVFPAPGYQTTRQFVRDAYKLINPSNPSQVLHGFDENDAIRYLNDILQGYAGAGVLITIAKQISIPLTVGQEFVTFGATTDVPTPDVTIGRLATLNSSWLDLSGVTYPLIQQNRDEFLASFKYDPLLGLPRFAIVYPDTQVVSVRLYPAPSQFFQFNLRGKFQLPILTSNSDMSLVPQYYIQYLKFALAKDLALFSGRAMAWTDELEKRYLRAEDQVLAASEINLTITGDRASLLNGSWRVMSGV